MRIRIKHAATLQMGKPPKPPIKINKHKNNIDNGRCTKYCQALRHTSAACRTARCVCINAVLADKPTQSA
jgi:hypothetical protein